MERPGHPASVVEALVDLKAFFKVSCGRPEISCRQ
jgi:hypothetical protein